MQRGNVLHFWKQWGCDQHVHQRQKSNDETCVPNPQLCVSGCLTESQWTPNPYFDTKNQYADTSTQGGCTSDQWGHFLRFFPTSWISWYFLTGEEIAVAKPRSESANQFRTCGLMNEGREREERERGSGLASTCCTPVSASFFSVRSFPLIGCWRPLCFHGHSGRRVARWAALADMEDEASSRSSSRSTSRIVSDHRNDDLPVPQVMEEILEVCENIHQEPISERVNEQIIDVPGTIAQPGDQARRVPAEFIHDLSTSVWWCSSRSLILRRRTNHRSTTTPSMPYFCRYSTSTRLLSTCVWCYGDGSFWYRLFLKAPSAQFMGTVVDVLVIMQIDQVTKQVLQTKYFDRFVAMFFVMQQQALSFRLKLLRRWRKSRRRSSPRQLWICPRRSRGWWYDRSFSFRLCEDRERLAGAAHERLHVQITDVPAHVALNERISERMHEQIVDVPVPRKIKENVEPESRGSAACGATTCSTVWSCGKDGFPVDQTGDQDSVQVCSSLHFAHGYVRRVIHVIVHSGLTVLEGVLVVICPWIAASGGIVLTPPVGDSRLLSAVTEKITINFAFKFLLRFIPQMNSCPPNTQVSPFQSVVTPSLWWFS